MDTPAALTRLSVAETKIEVLETQVSEMKGELNERLTKLDGKVGDVGNWTRATLLTMILALLGFILQHLSQ